MKYSLTVILNALSQICPMRSMCWARVFAQELLKQKWGLFGKVDQPIMIFCKHAVNRDVTHN